MVEYFILKKIINILFFVMLMRIAKKHYKKRITEDHDPVILAKGRKAAKIIASACVGLGVISLFLVKSTLTGDSQIATATYAVINFVINDLMAAYFLALFISRKKAAPKKS